MSMSIIEDRQTATDEPREIKPCAECGSLLPAIEFEKSHKPPYARGPVCKGCRAELRGEGSSQREAAVNRELNRAVVGLLNRVRNDANPLDALTAHYGGAAEHIHAILSPRDRRRGETPQETMAKLVGEVILNTVDDDDESNFGKLKATDQYNQLLALSVRRTSDQPLDFGDASDEELRAALFPAAQELVANDDEFLIRLVMSKGGDFQKRLLQEFGIDVIDGQAELPAESAMQSATESAVDNALSLALGV